MVPDPDQKRKKVEKVGTDRSIVSRSNDGDDHDVWRRSFVKEVSLLGYQ